MYTDNVFFFMISRFLTNVLSVLSIKKIFYSKAFQYLRYKKVFLDEDLKTRFSDIKKKLEKATKIQKLPQKIPDCFSITTINLICFMKML